MSGGGGGGGNLPIVSVYIATFYSFARSLLSAVSQLSHGHSKFGSGPGGGGGGGAITHLVTPNYGLGVSARFTIQKCT